MEWWSMTPTEVLKKLRTEERTGLSENEAKKRLETDGRNRTEQGEGKKGFRRRFLAQFNDFMILLLIGAAVASVAISYWNGEKDFLDAAIILAIVVLNAFLGVLQESRAEKALEALKALSAPKASVLRGGEEKEIPAEEVVQGDILLLAAGDYICADGRILENQGLKTEESAITGEALAIEKEEGVLAEKTLPSDRKNMVLAGSYVLAGRGTVAVTATGMATEIGKIAALLAEQEERETPLQKKLGETGRLLGMGALIICGIIFGMGLLRRQPPFPMFMTSVSLAVAAIPEGLPAIVTIVLAIGMQRMARKNTIIRRLPAVETLGSAEVICSDKTGTLTQNRMKVTRLAAIGKGLEQDEEKRRFILTLFTLCNDVKRQGTKIIGEPTEKALAEAAEEGGVSLKGLWEEMPRIGEVPFSSERKLMTTVHPSGEKWISVTKGAPDILFEKCAYCLDGGRQAVFDGRRKSEARLKNGEMAANALRVVAVAFREWDEEPLFFTAEELEGDLVFAGMAGYAFAKIDFKGRKFLFYMVLMAMMIPYQVIQVPLYILLVSKFQLSNTYISLILPGICTSYNIFLAKQFFASIPTALIESARIEGCGQFKTYRLIVLPLSKTILAVMAINTFLGSWNNFFWPFLATSKDKMFTIQVGLKTFKFANGTLLSPMMAGACISAVPMFILFFSLQKYFLEGVTVGAVKG